MKTCASCWTSAPRSRGPPNEFRWRAGTIRREALPLDGDGALAPLIDAVRNARVVLIGEASHGTHEFYRTRAELTKALIRDHGFDIVAVEADWPDAYRINRWVRGASQESGSGAGRLHAVPAVDVAQQGCGGLRPVAARRERGAARGRTHRLKAPTLLIVGGDDEPVIEMNQAAMRQLRSPVKLEIVAGATHLFEEPGALEQVATLATAWCGRHLRETSSELLDGVAPGELPGG